MLLQAAPIPTLGRRFGRTLNSRGLTPIGVGAVQSLTETPVPAPSHAGPHMPTPGDDLAAKVLRLQAERENLVYILGNSELSEEHRILVQKQLISVQNALVMLTGGISVN
jgi:hypothetical protein